MEKRDTKRAILDVAMDLFSTQGFEATSILQIATAVGIRKASLYNHFTSKQDILDTLLNETLTEYEECTIFAKSDWCDMDFTEDMKKNMSEAMVQTIQNQVRYILHDPKISKARKMLTIEQFQNSKMAAIQTKQNYIDVLAYFEKLMHFLVCEGKLKGYDTQMMSAQFCLPINVWIELCDREPEREGEIMLLIERHVKQFFTIYGTNADD